MNDSTEIDKQIYEKIMEMFGVYPPHTWKDNTGCGIFYQNPLVPDVTLYKSSACKQLWIHYISDDDNPLSYELYDFFSRSARYYLDQKIAEQNEERITNFLNLEFKQ